MIRVGESAEDFVKKHFNIEFMTACSSIHSGIAGIPEAYNEAIEAMEYKKVFGVNGVLCYNDLQHSINVEYFYPIEIEQQLINFLRTGDYENSNAVLLDVFDKNFNNHSISIEIARCITFNILSTMLKTLNSEMNVSRYVLLYV